MKKRFLISLVVGISISSPSFAKQEKKTLQEWLSQVPKGIPSSKVEEEEVEQEAGQEQEEVFENSSTEDKSSTYIIVYTKEKGRQELSKDAWNKLLQSQIGPFPYHRVDGPACEWLGNKYWYKDGRLHRERGPAVIHADGSIEYWLDGKMILQMDKNGKEKSKL